MKLVEINWHPSRRQLRQFGVLCLFALPLIGWLWGGGATLTGLLALVGLALAVAGAVLPGALKPVFLAISIVAAPVGLVLGELVLLATYFGLFTPMAFVFRLAGRDALKRKVDRQATTYWRTKKPPGGPASYYRQS